MENHNNGASLGFEKKALNLLKKNYKIKFFITPKFGNILPKNGKV